MKKKIIAIVLAALMVFSVFGCGDKTPTVEFTISLDKTTASIVAGDTVKLTPTMTDATATITWKSSDVSKATVDGGVVTGVAAGVADITATANGKTAKCVVTVAPKIVTTITLSETTLKLAVGMTEKLTATVTPVATPIWSSSNKAVATVGADGTITAVGAGEAKIIASVGEYKGECSLTVVSPYIKLDNKTKDMYIGKTWLVDYSMLPSGDITWVSSDITVATVDGATETVTAIKVGTTTLTATCGDATDSCVITVKPAPTITLSNTNLTLDKSATTYPSSGSTVATVNDSGVTTPTINYTSSNDAIATVAANGTISAVGAGNAIITADYNGFTANCDVLVKDYTDYAVIHTPKQFDDIRNNLSKTGKYVLGNNIDMKGVKTGLFGGVNNKGEQVFDGILDGNGYAVSNFMLAVNTTGEGMYRSGLFHHMGGSSVVRDIALTGVIAWFGNNCGVITCMNEGTIENVYMEVQYNLNNYWSHTSGTLVGTNMLNGKISNCVVKVAETSKKKVDGTESFKFNTKGALAGMNTSKNTINNCFISFPDTIFPNNQLTGKVGENGNGKEVDVINCAKKTEAELADGALYEAYSKNVWNITTDGVPTLKNQERVAPAIVELYDTDGVFTDNTLQLRAVYNKEGVIHYSSSNPLIASVDQSGVVTALTVGKTTITADIEAITNETIATIDVSVGLIWKTADINAVVAPSYELIPTTAAGASITWTSEDEEIAIVDAGTVGAVKSGTVKIVAQIGDVKSKITLQTKKLDVENGLLPILAIGETHQVQMENVFDRTLTYTSSDTTVATISATGLITTKKSGVTNITCSAELNAAHAEESCVKELTVSNDTCLWKDDFDTDTSADYKDKVNASVKTHTSGKMAFSKATAWTNTVIAFPDSATSAIAGKDNYTIITRINIDDVDTGTAGDKKTRYFALRYKFANANELTKDFAQMCVRQGAKTCNGGGVEFAQNVNGAWEENKVSTVKKVAYSEDLAPTKYYVLKIEVVGKNVKQFIDGNLVTEGTMRDAYLVNKLVLFLSTNSSKKITVNMDYLKVYEPIVTPAA